MLPKGGDETITKMTRSHTRSRAHMPDPEALGRFCEAPGCECAAAHRAPKSRLTLREYRWFCLDHVRLYNANWDYYKGMSPEQIEEQLREDTSWQRPSWPLGRMRTHGLEEELLEPLFTSFAQQGRQRPSPAVPKAPPEIRDALAILNLPWPVTLDEVKARYKDLAKRMHPDANGGDKTAEEKLKIINQAYSLLRRTLVPAE